MKNYNKIFEDFFDDLEVPEDNITDQIDSETTEKNIKNLFETDIDSYQYVFEFYISSIKRSTGKSGLQKNINRYKKFQHTLSYILDISKYITEHSVIVFRGFEAWSKRNDDIHNIDGLLINNNEDYIDEKFFNDSKVSFKFGFNVKSAKTPKDVYNIIKSILYSFKMSVKNAWGPRTFAVNITDYSKMHNDLTLSCYDIENIILKKPKEREKFLKIVKNFLGDSDRYNAIQFYNGEEMSEEMYSFYRYAGIIGTDIKKTYDEKNKILTINIDGAEWKCKKEVSRLIEKAKSYGYKLKIVGRGGFIDIIANGNKDLELWRSLIEFPIHSIYINIPKWDISGWQRKKIIDIRDWKADRVYISPGLGNYSNYYLKKDLFPYFPIFLTSCGERDPYKKYS